MSAEIIQFVPKANSNRDVLDRMIGVPPQPYSSRDPHDPNVDTAPSEYVAPDGDCA